MIMLQSMMNRKHSTKDYITIALYYLMSKKDYESTTVTDICNKARVSRMSFYRYFNNKEDIFINYCDERFEEFFAEIKEKNITDIKSFLIEIFLFLKKYARQVSVLKKAGKENLIIEKFTDYGTYLAKHLDLMVDNSPIANRILAAFLAGGTANILLLWLKISVVMVKMLLFILVEIILIALLFVKIVLYFVRACFITIIMSLIILISMLLAPCLIGFA